MPPFPHEEISPTKQIRTPTEYKVFRFMRQRTKEEQERIEQRHKLNIFAPVSSRWFRTETVEWPG